MVALGACGAGAFDMADRDTAPPTTEGRVSSPEPAGAGSRQPAEPAADAVTTTSTEREVPPVADLLIDRGFDGYIERDETNPVPNGQFSRPLDERGLSGRHNIEDQMGGELLDGHVRVWSSPEDDVDIYVVLFRFDGEVAARNCGDGGRQALGDTRIYESALESVSPSAVYIDTSDRVVMATVYFAHGSYCGTVRSQSYTSESHLSDAMNLARTQIAALEAAGV